MNEHTLTHTHTDMHTHIPHPWVCFLIQDNQGRGVRLGQRWQVRRLHTHNNVSFRFFYNDLYMVQYDMCYVPRHVLQDKALSQPST